MKRKVVKHGPSSLTVSLPMKWVKKLNIKPGDELELVEQNNTVSFVHGDFKKKQKEIEVNIDKLDYFSLAKLLIACYEEGYDSVTLLFSKNLILDAVPKKKIDVFQAIDRLIGRLVSFEIISQTHSKIVIHDISERLAKFDIIASRIFFLIEEYLGLLIEDIKDKNFEDLNARETRHDTISRYIALSCRILMDDISRTRSEAVNLFLIFNYLDKVTDFIRYGYKSTQNFSKKISKDCLKLMERTLEHLKIFRSSYL
ncbi:AbrB/MazE/SpoVT family DNA-binding domain-containing protein [Nanoarchaeota archaeon]